MFFVVVGELILNGICIPLPAFEIAGGIILFLFALTMIFGESKPEEEVEMVANVEDTAIYPLAVPSIASPGAMLAAVLMTDNSRYNYFEQVQTTLVMLLVLGIVLILMLAASRIHRLIGTSGLSVISRVMGVMLASLAVYSVLSGFVDFFGMAV